MPKATTLTETNLIEQEINPTPFPTTHINGTTKTNKEWCDALEDAKMYKERVEQLERQRDYFSEMYDQEVRKRCALGKENIDLEKLNASARSLAKNMREQKDWLEKVLEREQRSHETTKRQLHQTLQNYEEAMQKLLQMDSKWDDLWHLVLELSKDRGKLPCSTESWTRHQHDDLIEVVDQFLQDTGSIK